MGPPEARREPAPAGTWRGLYGLVALGLGLRLAVAFASDSVHHPDEVFQYAEQAHRLVFRYGVIPWEYRFGARSWLLPLFISGPLEAARLLRHVRVRCADSWQLCGTRRSQRIQDHDRAQRTGD
jgi:hypothetical protein